MSEPYVFHDDPSTVFYNPYNHDQHTKEERLLMLAVIYSLLLGLEKPVTSTQVERVLTHVANSTSHLGVYRPNIFFPLPATLAIVPATVSMGRNMSVSFFRRGQNGESLVNAGELRVDYFRGGRLAAEVEVRGWMLDHVALGRVEPTIKAMSNKFLAIDKEATETA